MGELRRKYEGLKQAHKEVAAEVITLRKLVESLKADNATLWAAIMDKEEKDE